MDLAFAIGGDAMTTKTVDPRSQRSLEPTHLDTILICLLGSFRVLRDGRQLDVLITGKSMALLSTLALRIQCGMPREALLETLWPEQDFAQATESLNSLVYSLHRRLRTESRGASAIVHDNGSYHLNTTHYSTDIVDFDALVAGGNRLVARSEEPEAAVLYERAAVLYRGDLCIGTDVYAIIERERLRANFLTILAWLADRAYRESDYAGALEHARKLLAVDPYREDAHRIVMRAHVRMNERSQALRQYRLCEQVLRLEFDAIPETPTTELFDRIRLDTSSI